jgi:1,4-dihydroxy-2-naphthoate polyprenyltransferase
LEEESKVSRLVTIEKSSPDFQKYLLGTFSEREVAIPVQSLNVNKASEQITFKVIDKTEIELPFFLTRWLLTVKVKNFTLVLFPIFIILVKNIYDDLFIEPLLPLLSCIGVICLHAAVNLRNDYYDHVSGVDRINPEVGSRAIQEGWITAAELRRTSIWFRVIGLLLGFPALVSYPQLVLFGLPVLFFGFVSHSYSPVGFRYRRWSEISAFFLLGPLLTAGFEISIRGDFDFETVAIGIILGWLAVFVLHLRNFQSILVQSQAEFINSINWLGFDRAKKLLLSWWFIFICMFWLYHSTYTATFWTFFSTAFLVMASLPFVIRLTSMESPIGSLMARVTRRGKLLYATAVTIWFVENLFYWLEKNGFVI